MQSFKPGILAEIEGFSDVLYPEHLDGVVK
jgi:hypothetical protein